jgi:hypothetical protein
MNVQIGHCVFWRVPLSRKVSVPLTASLTHGPGRGKVQRVLLQHHRSGLGTADT